MSVYRTTGPLVYFGLFIIVFTANSEVPENVVCLNSIKLHPFAYLQGCKA